MIKDIDDEWGPNLVPEHSEFPEFQREMGKSLDEILEEWKTQEAIDSLASAEEFEACFNAMIEKYTWEGFKNMDRDGEVWRQLPPCFNASKYQISNYGRLKHSRLGVSNGRVMTSGYIYTILTLDDGTTKRYLVHRLVAITFIPNPDNRAEVDHIDRDRQNNRVDNLRWVTRSENLSNRKKWIQSGRPVVQLDPKTGAEIARFDTAKLAGINFGKTDGNSVTQCAMGKRDTAHGYAWKYVTHEEREGEEWKEYVVGERRYFISNHGRVKDAEDRIINLSGDNGYLACTLAKTRYMVHRLVCELFIGPPPSPEQNTVNHKDHNSKNNHVDNLEWASMAEQIAHQRKPKNAQRLRKPVKQIVPATGEVVATFPSAKNAAEVLKLNRANIVSVLNGRLETCGGYYWKYA